MRRAIDAGDWPRVRTLADGAATAQEQLAARREVLELADAVYGTRAMRVDPVALSMSGVIARPAGALERERAAIIGHLRALAAADGEWAAFYRSRADFFERLRVVAEDDRGAPRPVVHLRGQLLAALERSDFAAVKRLTDAIVIEGQRGTLGRVRVHAPEDSRVRALSARCPPAAVERAHDIGLAEQQVSAALEIDAYLSCRCGERPTIPDVALSATNRVSSGCTCGHACPPEIAPALRNSLDWLLLHPFMSSVGSRYLPWFGDETVLVETFPETEPDARTPLLDELSLPRRRGLSRIVIEDALRSHGPRLCARLGLDAFEFVLACIPFDVYLRLAPRQGWGRAPSWTHFDGYQIIQDPALTVLALVGGDVGYGGADDLCAVQRDYEAERITARFCVVRRQRFLARETRAQAPQR
jgi:hypothetical protein